MSTVETFTPVTDLELEDLLYLIRLGGDPDKKIKVEDFSKGLLSSDIVEITDGTDVVDDFPLASELVGEKLYKRYGSGSGKRTLNCQGSDVLNWGDAETTTVDIEGSGILVICSDGLKLHVKEYTDYGSNSQENWRKMIDGTMFISGQHSEINAAITTLQGSVYRSNAFTRNYNSATPARIIIPIVVLNVQNPAVWICGGGLDTVNQFSFMLLFPTSITSTTPVTFHATTRWRA